MAFALTERYHGADAAVQARERLDTLHIRREVPEEVEEFGFDAENAQVHLPALHGGGLRALALRGLAACSPRAASSSTAGS